MSALGVRSPLVVLCPRLRICYLAMSKFFIVFCSFQYQCILLVARQLHLSDSGSYYYLTYEEALIIAERKQYKSSLEPAWAF